MKTFFECKSRFNAIDEKGKEVVKTESYLVDAVSFTEAEAKTLSYLEKIVSGGSTVTAIKRSSIEDVVNVSEEGKYFVAKIRFIDVDDTGKGKAATFQLLVQADTPDQTLEGVKKYTSEFLVDLSVTQITESKIIDVIPVVDVSE